MAKQETLEASIKTERRRLQRARDKAAQKRTEVDRELEAIERELAAMDAYLKAKGGKSVRAKRTQAKRAAKRTAAPRARRGEKRQAIIGLVSQHPEGLSRGEIISLIGVKGDKSGEQSVSNALSALTKQNQLGKRDGKYMPA